MTSIVKAANAAQFLALVPRLAGYQPTESLVLVPFVGTRTTGVMRVDLPVGADADEVDRCAATFLGMICRLPEVDGFAAIVYTAASYRDGMPHRALLEALAVRADAAGLRVSDALCVAADGWGSTLDPESPDAGWDLDEIERGAEAMPELPAPTGDQASGATLPAPDLATKERVARALTQLDAAIRAVLGTPTKERIDPRAVAAIVYENVQARDLAPHAVPKGRILLVANEDPIGRAERRVALVVVRVPIDVEPKDVRFWTKIVAP